jgi:hypothetical protein
MEDKAVKLIAYIGLLAVIVWAVASALGKRDQLGESKSPCTRRDKAQGDVWARKTVPRASSNRAAAVIPTPGF